MLLLLKRAFLVRSKESKETISIRVFLDVAAHYLAAAGISALRRTKKSDNNRISRATGATIVNDTADLKEEDVGTGCGVFEIRKIGDEYEEIKNLISKKLFSL
jgi:chaperonin GroEL (HSP60 family)